MLVTRHDAVTLARMSLSNQKAGGSVRIIGGEWRSRRLSFPDADGLRPTADRVRETLFNWLQLSVPAARVLDLFAGSGALAFEAASRGASRVLMVERNGAVAASLRANRDKLGAETMQIVQADAQAWLDQKAAAAGPFDIVFMDPPFAESMHESMLQALAKAACLAPGALIYLETPAALEATMIPENWRVAKRKRAGAVFSTLLQAA